MLVLTLGVSQWVASLLVALFLLVCLLLILIVLIQRPQGGGLGGAFGSGGGSGQTAFGAKTGDALTIATIGIFVLYLVIAVGLQFAARPSSVPDRPAAIGTAGDDSDEPVDVIPPGQVPADGDPETPAPQPEATEPAPSDPVGEPADDDGDETPDGG